MTDRPIIFSAPMVRALLAGRKTQTRRLATSPLRKCAVGDRLYVREAWRFAGWTDDGECEIDYLADGAKSEWLSPPDDGGTISQSRFFDREAARAYDACALADHMMGEIARPPPGWLPGRPSIHMPRWASRLTLIVEGVKVEPLQAISEADAWAEGVCVAVENEQRSKFGDCADEDRRAIVAQIVGDGRAAYRWLWEQLHDKAGQRWEDNPEVVCLTFRVIAGNIDQVPA